MALTHTQGYKDNTKEESIFRAASRLINLKEKTDFISFVASNLE